MQVLPIQGLFIMDKKSKDEFLSPEDLKKREEAAAAARAWEEATAKTDINANSIKIRETVSIAPEDSVSL